MDIGLGPGVPLEVSVSLLRVLQKWARLALQPTAAEPKCAVPKSRSQFCPLGGCGSKGLLGDPEKEGASECPWEPYHGCPAKSLQLHYRRWVSRGMSQLKGIREGGVCGGESQGRLEDGDCLISGVSFFVQPATLLFLESGWVSSAMT